MVAVVVVVVVVVTTHICFSSLKWEHFVNFKCAVLSPLLLL